MYAKVHRVRAVFMLTCFNVIRPSFYEEPVKLNKKGDVHPHFCQGRPSMSSLENGFDLHKLFITCARSFQLTCKTNDRI